MSAHFFWLAVSRDSISLRRLRSSVSSFLVLSTAEESFSTEVPGKQPISGARGESLYVSQPPHRCSLGSRPQLHSDVTRSGDPLGRGVLLHNDALPDSPPKVPACSPRTADPAFGSMWRYDGGGGLWCGFRRRRITTEELTRRNELGMPMPHIASNRYLFIYRLLPPNLPVGGLCFHISLS